MSHIYPLVPGTNKLTKEVRTKYYNRRTAYYTNSPCTFNPTEIILCGNIEVNLGPNRTDDTDDDSKTPHPSTARVNPPSISLLPTGLRICHWNIRSLNNDKFEQIKSMLLKPDTQLDILIITETWLDSSHSDGEYYIPEYLIERKDKRGGGVLMYISSHLTYTRARTFET